MKFINQDAHTNAMHAMNANFFVFVKIRMLHNISRDSYGNAMIGRYGGGFEEVVWAYV